MRVRTLAVASILLVCLACSSSAERRDKAFVQAEGLFKQGELAAAQAQARRAIELDPKFARGYELLGRIQFRQQQLQPARTTLEKAVQLDPGLLEAQLTLGEIYLMTGRTSWAGDKADLVLASRKSAEALLLKAAVERAGGDPSAALGWCRKAIAAEPSRPEGYLLSAEISVQMGHLDKAAAVLKAGSAKVADSAPLQVSLAQVYMGQKRPELAERTIAELVRKHPQEAKLRLLLAEYYSRQGKRKEAEAELRRAVALRPDLEPVQVELVDFLLASGRAKEAEAQLKQALTRVKPGYVLRSRLARLYGATGREDEAVATYRAAIALDPKRPEARAMRKEMAALFLEQHQPERALPEIEAVLKADPGDEGAAFLRGKALLAKGEAADAVSVLEKVVKAQPESAEACLWLAQAQVAANLPALARETLKEAVRRNPGNGQLRRALARAYMGEGDLDAAKAELELALKADPKDVVALADLGAIHAAKGDMSQAEHCFKKLIELRPDSHVGYYRLGLLAAHEGKYEEAAKQLAEACRLAPGFGPAASALVRTYLARGESAKALDWLKARIEARPKDAWLRSLAGELQMITGDVEGAEEQLLTAQRLAPDWRIPYDSLAVLYVRTGRVGQAIGRLKDSFQKGGSPQSGFMLAVLQEMSRDYDGARATYGRLLASRPGFALAASNLAFLLADRYPGRSSLVEADRLACKALADKPDDPFFLDTAGWVAYRRGEVSKARGLLERALAQQPESPIFNYHVGMLYLKEHQAAQAKRHLQQAVDSGQDFMGIEEARQALAGAG